MTSFPELTLLTAAVDHQMETSFAIPTPRVITALAAPSTDIVGTRTLTAELDARADVPAPRVLGVALERPLHLQRRLGPKSPCWARLRVRPPMAVTLLTVLVALGMGTPFVVAGQTVLVVLFTGSVGIQLLIAAVDVKVGRAQVLPKSQCQAHHLLPRLRMQVSSKLLVNQACQLCMQASCRTGV